jgi:hypothetical protein
MKIYIGPYSYAWYSQIHYNYMNKKYKHQWDQSNTPFERFLEKVEVSLDKLYAVTINKIIAKRQTQKIKVRIDDYDVWSMDNTLAQIISPMLKKLKEHKHGSAYVENEDVPQELQHPVTDDPDHDSLVEKRWDYVLNEMIWAFEQKARPEGWEGDYYDFEHDPTKMLGLKFTRNDREGQKNHQARMANGFRLFGKYYEALWD